MINVLCDDSYRVITVVVILFIVQTLIAQTIYKREAVTIGDSTYVVDSRRGDHYDTLVRTNIWLAKKK